MSSSMGVQNVSGRSNNLTLGKKPVFRSAKSLQRAENFLQMDKYVQSYFENKWLKSSSPLVRSVGSFFNTITGAFSKHDYSSIYNVPGLGRIGIAAPLGSIATMVILFTLSARLVYAAKRLRNNDSREIGDILRRDLPTLVMLVFLMDPMIKAFTHFVQNKSGFMLLNQPTKVPNNASILGKIKSAFTSEASPLSYTQLEKYFKLNSASRLKEVINNPVNLEGVKTALHRFGQLKMNTEQKGLYSQFKQSLSQPLSKVSNGQSIKTVESFNKTMRLVEAFEKASIKAGNGLNIRNIFVEPAKFARHGSAIFGLGSMVFLLGYGVIKFNEWWSVTQYEKLRQQMLNRMPTNLV